MRDIKLVVTDMDGTFLDGTSSIPAENLRAVDRLKARGVPVVLCTGRPVPIIRSLANEAHAHPVVISCNGAAIYDLAAERMVSASFMSSEAVRAIVGFCLERGLDCLAYSEDWTIYYSRTSERIGVFTRYNDRFPDDTATLVSLETVSESLNALRFVKILVTAKQDEQLAITQEFLQSLPSIYAVSSMSGVIDVMAGGVSKGDALVHLAKDMGIALENVCAIGDNENDVSMFEAAGYSVCMKNGNPIAKQRATTVSDRTNDEAGFAAAVEFI